MRNFVKTTAITLVLATSLSMVAMAANVDVSSTPSPEGTQNGYIATRDDATALFPEDDAMPETTTTGANEGIMLISAAPVADFTDYAKIENDYAVARLVEYGIINGNPDGTFAPENNVTRAEMAKMISVLVNKGEPTTTETTTFDDTQGHWAEKYIADCVERGIIAGRNESTFDPEANVTGAEAGKMLAVVLGVDAEKAELVGADWEANTNRVIMTFSLDNGVDTDEISGAITKDTAAQMLSNTLDAGVATYSETMYLPSDETVADSLGYEDAATEYVDFMYKEMENAGVYSSFMNYTNDIESQLSIDPSMLTDAVFGVAAISTVSHEIFIGKVADEANVDEVLEALEARKDYIINTKAFYPGDKEASQDTIVVSNGNYVMLCYAQDMDKAEEIFNLYTK